MFQVINYVGWLEAEIRFWKSLREKCVYICHPASNNWDYSNLKIPATDTVKENQSPAEVNILLEMLTLHWLSLYLVHRRKPGIQHFLFGQYHVTASSSMASFAFLP